MILANQEILEALLCSPIVYRVIFPQPKVWVLLKHNEMFLYISSHTVKSCWPESSTDVIFQYISINIHACETLSLFQSDIHRHRFQSQQAFCFQIQAI